MNVSPQRRSSGPRFQSFEQNMSTMRSPASAGGMRQSEPLVAGFQSIARFRSYSEKEIAQMQDTISSQKRRSEGNVSASRQRRIAATASAAPPRSPRSGYARLSGRLSQSQATVQTPVDDNKKQPEIGQQVLVSQQQIEQEPTQSQRNKNSITAEQNKLLEEKRARNVTMREEERQKRCAEDWIACKAEQKASIARREHAKRVLLEKKDAIHAYELILRQNRESQVEQLELERAQKQGIREQLYTEHATKEILEQKQIYEQTRQAEIARKQALREEKQKQRKAELDRKAQAKALQAKREANLLLLEQKAIEGFKKQQQQLRQSRAKTAETSG